MLCYDYTAAKEFCKQIGLVWIGDSFVAGADHDAAKLDFTQAQVDSAMRHHLWQVKFLFSPKNYPITARIRLAFWFLFGSEPRVR